MSSPSASNHNPSQRAAVVSTQSGLPAAAWGIGAVMTAVILALSATLVWTQTHRGDAALAPTALTAPAAVALAAPASAALTAAPVVALAAVPAAPPAVHAPTVRHTAPRAPTPRAITVAQAPAPTPSPQPDRGWERSTPNAQAGWEQPTPRHAQVVSCPSCGTVESVRPVEQRGEATGLGAVIGGVVGGAVGNQVGGGNGRKAATVIGVIGGGIAGHEIEKRQRSHTVYEVQVRMEDGSSRIITQSQSISVGTPVQVNGDSLSVRSRSSERNDSGDYSSYSNGDGGRTWRTGT